MGYLWFCVIVQAVVILRLANANRLMRQDIDATTHLVNRRLDIQTRMIDANASRSILLHLTDGRHLAN